MIHSLLRHETPCGDEYSGPSFPHRHGLKCIKQLGHDSSPDPYMARHWSVADDGHLISWYSAKQKAALDAKDRA